jgi:hypothetical protein
MMDTHIFQKIYLKIYIRVHFSDHVLEDKSSASFLSPLCVVTVCMCMCVHTYTQTNKQTPWPLVRERTIPTERPPLVDEI